VFSRRQHFVFFCVIHDERSIKVPPMEVTVFLVCDPDEGPLAWDRMERLDHNIHAVGVDGEEVNFLIYGFGNVEDCTPREGGTTWFPYESLSKESIGALVEEEGGGGEGGLWNQHTIAIVANHATPKTRGAFDSHGVRVFQWGGPPLREETRVNMISIDDEPVLPLSFDGFYTFDPTQRKPIILVQDSLEDALGEMVRSVLETFGDGVEIRFTGSITSMGEWKQLLMTAFLVVHETENVELALNAMAFECPVLPVSRKNLGTLPRRFLVESVAALDNPQDPEAFEKGLHEGSVEIATQNTPATQMDGLKRLLFDAPPQWVMVGLLTSRRPDLLVQCAKSIYNQQQHSLPYHVYAVVNSLTEGYADTVRAALRGAGLSDCIVVTTESNGTPGRGHNSVLRLFESMGPKYTHLVMVDGDDTLYPSAFHQLEKTLERAPDVVHLMCNDSVVAGVHAPHLKTVGMAPGNLWENPTMVKTIGNPFQTPLRLSAIRTPSRILLVNQKGSRAVRYDEKMIVYDDYPAFLGVVEATISNQIRSFVISDTCVYCYNQMDDDSTSSNTRDPQKMINEHHFFLQSLEAFPSCSALWKQWANNWERRTFSLIPYAHISPPHWFSKSDKGPFVETFVAVPHLQEAKRDLSRTSSSPSDFIGKLERYRQFGGKIENTHRMAWAGALEKIGQTSSATQMLVDVVNLDSSNLAAHSALVRLLEKNPHPEASNMAARHKGIFQRLQKRGEEAAKDAVVQDLIKFDDCIPMGKGSDDGSGVPAGSLSCVQINGLGNVLFQAATTIAAGQASGRDVIFTDWTNTPWNLKPWGGHGSTESWGTLGSIFPNLHEVPGTHGVTHLDWQWMPPKSDTGEGGQYIDVDGALATHPLGKSTQIAGYFFNARYWHSARNVLVKMFAFSPDIVEQARNSVQEIDVCPERFVSVHLRFYTDHADSSNNIQRSQPKAQWFVGLLKRLCKEAPHRMTIVVCSDNMKKAQWFVQEGLKEVTGLLDVVLLDQDRAVCLAAMSMCRGGHILSNSSLSFWGAYLDTDQPNTPTFIHSSLFDDHPKSMIPYRQWKVVQ
jgi:hypothetical protein